MCPLLCCYDLVKVGSLWLLELLVNGFPGQGNVLIDEGQSFIMPLREKNITR